MASGTVLLSGPMRGGESRLPLCGFAAADPDLAPLQGALAPVGAVGGGTVVMRGRRSLFLGLSRGCS